MADAEAKDAETEGQGWTCFGGTGSRRASSTSLDDAAWLGAWAPAARSPSCGTGTASRWTQGSRIVMQVHYNLLAGQAAGHLGDADPLAAAGPPTCTALHTMLMPAPVELPCRPEHDDGPLCDREAAVAGRQGPVRRGPGQPGERAAPPVRHRGPSPPRPWCAPVRSTGR